ncbi:putative uncharacterized protein TRPC5OS [Pteronotus mesoamericanus]|uniref:putative uncharacterized protein TRPC5OS n=1 Tax=Pteronotus mesoamericanus TaxID=1884717 RepID=UPI0023ED7951|nr:putative uncharacterized protein TRPC5OS [Pteronotus parnellii mesoamericanus]
MDAASIPVLVGGLVDCLAQLIIIAEEILQLMSQEQVPCVEQNDAAEQPGADSAPPEEASRQGAALLPDLANLPDLESILTPKEEEELMFDIDQAMLDVESLYGEVLSSITDDLRCG